MNEMIKRVSDAIARVQLFSRWNDWSRDHVPGQPIEIFRFGVDGEPEIVIVARYTGDFGENEALSEQVSIAQARAAIEAMREPTEGMIDEGGRAYLISSGSLPVTNTRVWRAMIDAALKAP